MKRIWILPLFIVLLMQAAAAQDDELPPPSRKPFKTNAYNNDDVRRTRISKYLIEPNVTFSIMPHAFELGGSPYLGYNVWKGLCVGGGVTYIYTRFKNVPLTDALGKEYPTSATWHTYGGGVYLQYNIWKGLFARTRFEVLHREIQDIQNASLDFNSQTNNYYVSVPKVKATLPALLVGVGYNITFNRGFFLPIMVSYNVLNSVTDKRLSPYSNGLAFQIGFISAF